MRESAFGWAGRLRWRLRVERLRLLDSLRGSQFVFGVFLYFGSNRRVARRLRVAARRDPTGLLTHEAAPAEVSDDPRRELYADIAEDLIDTEPVGPQLIVGEVGAGKTTARRAGRVLRRARHGADVRLAAG
jgi:hypothetical protein